MTDEYFVVRRACCFSQFDAAELASLSTWLEVPVCSFSSLAGRFEQSRWGAPGNRSRQVTLAHPATKYCVERASPIAPDAIGLAWMVGRSCGRVMTETGVSQSELSRIGGVRQPSLSQFLSGRIEMSDEMLDRVLSCLGYRLEVVRRPVRVELDRSHLRSWRLHRQLATHLDRETLDGWGSDDPAECGAVAAHRSGRAACVESGPAGRGWSTIVTWLRSAA